MAAVMARSLGAFMPHCRGFAQLKADADIGINRCHGHWAGHKRVAASA